VLSSSWNLLPCPCRDSEKRVGQLVEARCYRLVVLDLIENLLATAGCSARLFSDIGNARRINGSALASRLDSLRWPDFSRLSWATFTCSSATAISSRRCRSADVRVLAVHGGFDELMVQQCRLGRVLGLSGKPCFGCRKLVSAEARCLGASTRVPSVSKPHRSGCVSAPTQFQDGTGSDARRL